MKYFEGLFSEKEIKARYKELAKKNHPDLGGSTEIMKEINAQYDQVLTGQYQKDGKSITEVEELLAKDTILRDKLNEIISLEGLEIELCGYWLWVTGKTQENKDTLKQASFRWARKKKAWYFRTEDKKSYNRKTYSFDEIRGKYGSSKINSQQYKKLA